MLSQPSVITRLMGMEPQPTSFPATRTMMMIARDCSEEEEEAMELLRSARATPTSFSSSGEASSAKLIDAAAESRQSKCNPLLSSHSSRRRAGEYDGGGYYYRRCLDKMKRPLRRDGRSWSSSSLRRLSYHGGRHRHPQEELLGKIREDFQAWLHASSSSSSSPAPAVAGLDAAAAVVVGRRSTVKPAAGCLDGRYVQMIAQENLRREKVLARCAGGGHGRGGGRSECEVEDEETRKNGAGGLAAAAAAAMVVAECEEFSRAASGSAVDGGHDQQQRGGQTRIAILRPTTGGGGDRRGPALGTPLTWKAGTRDDLGGGGMEEFLREVRERLRSEMAARSVPLPMTRDTASSMAAAQSRAAVPSKGDDGGKLLGSRRKNLKMMSRSESFRVFRGDRKRAAAAGRSPSPELGTAKATGRGGRRGMSLQPDAASPADARRSPARLPQEAGSDVAVSPRALLRRSFSSPATGFSSLPRRNGAPDDTSSEAGAELTSSSRRSRSFSLVRGTAASLKQSFSIGGKLKQLMLHLSNSKKKPSSPCPVDDLVGLAPRSPVSPLEVEGHSRHFSLSGEIISCSSFPELSPKCSSEFDAPVAVGSPLEPKASDGGSESEGDPDKAYLREVITAAGLWHVDGGGSEEGKTNSSDVVKASMAAPIGEEVFDEIEDAYYYSRCRRGEEECAVVDAGEEDDEEERGYGAARRRLLFDLANEALQQQQQAGSSSLRRWVVGNGVRSSSPSLRGKELEEEVLRQVARATAVEEKDDPAAAAEREVLGRCSAWLEAAAWEEEVRAVGSKVERAIFDDLVGQVVRQQLASCLTVNTAQFDFISL